MTTYEEIAGLPNPQRLGQIKEIYQTVLDVFDEDEFNFRINNFENLFTILAFCDADVVGFKLGYQLDSTKFYSWIGGVKSEFRKRGIAGELMKRQHDWCRKTGYKIVQTKTMNKFKPMLILNLRHGFDVVELQRNNQNEIKIVLEKRL